MAERKTGRQYMCTNFRNGGRRAGDGMLHDDYSEESGNRDYEKHDMVRFPHDNVKPEEMNWEVVIVQRGKGTGGME